MNQERVALGRCARPHGIHGWLRVISYTDPLEKICSYPLFLADGRQITVTESRCQHDKLWLKLEGVDDRAAAGALLHQELLSERQAFLDLSPGQYYWHDLIGCQVINEDAHCFGQVASLFDNGAHDILIINNDNKEETMIPWVAIYIESVDLDNKRIAVRWTST